MDILKVLPLVLLLSGVAVSVPVSEQDKGDAAATQSKTEKRTELLKELLAKLKPKSDNENVQKTDKSQPKRQFCDCEWSWMETTPGDYCYEKCYTGYSAYHSDSWAAAGGYGTYSGWYSGSGANNYWGGSGTQGWGTTGYSAYGAYQNMGGYSSYGNMGGYSAYGNPAGYGTYGNPAGYGTYDNTAGYGTYGNPAGYGTYGNPAGYGTYGNTAGYGSYGNTAGYGTYGNTAGYGTGQDENAYWNLEEMVLQALNTVYDNNVGWSQGPYSYWKRTLSQFRRERSHLQRKELQKGSNGEGNINPNHAQTRGNINPNHAQSANKQAPKVSPYGNNHSPDNAKTSDNNKPNNDKRSNNQNDNNKVDKRYSAMMTVELKDDVTRLFADLVDELYNEYMYVINLPTPSDSAGMHQCAYNEFRCMTTTCIPSSWECDGWDDCTDGSDEYDCPWSYNTWKRTIGNTKKQGQGLKTLKKLLENRKRELEKKQTKLNE